MRFSFLLALFLFFLLQFYLRYHLDLRDLPGAAGSLSVYRALEPTAQNGSDWSALCLYYLQGHLGFSIQTCNDILSIVSGLLGFIGGYFAGLGLCGTKRGVGLLLLALWPFPHYFALLTGVDTPRIWNCMVCDWASLLGNSSSMVWNPLVCLGLTLLPLSISIKESALPVLVFSIWSLFSIPKWKKNWSLLLVLIIGGYSLFWSYTWFFPNNPTRLNQTPISLEVLRQGWKQLQILPHRGHARGKI